MESEATSEHDWIHLAQTGDRTAFQRLAEAHVERLCRCALAMCHDRQIAEDLAQETLIEAWRSLARFDGRCLFSTWLYGILRHRFLKHIRRAANLRPHGELTDAAERLPDAAAGPEARLQQAEDAARLRQALEQLSYEHRQVIELRFFGDARLEDIAVLLDVALGTVKSRLHNGLEKLRKLSLSVNLFSESGESRARQ